MCVCVCVCVTDIQYQRAKKKIVKIIGSYDSDRIMHSCEWLANFLVFAMVKPEKKSHSSGIWRYVNGQSVFEVSRQPDGLVLKGSNVFFNISTFLEK